MHYLLVGMHSGRFLCANPRGDILCSRILHSSSLFKIKIVHKMHDSFIDEIAGLQFDIVLLYAPNIIVYLEGHSFTSCLVVNGSGSLKVWKWRLQCDYVLDVEAFDSFDLNSQTSDMRSTIHLVAGGNFPMLSFARTDETAWDFSVATLGIKVAEKVSSAVFSMASSFLGQSASPTTEFKKSTPLKLQSSSILSDPSRIVQSVSLNPQRTLAICSDNYGRVLLLDVVQFVIVRMWKGYRNAQCGWISDFARSEQDSCDQRFTSSLIVIYAPLRGLVELWKTSKGPRVAAIEVTENHVMYSFCSVWKGEFIARSFLSSCSGELKEIMLSSTFSRKNWVEKRRGLR